MSGADWRPSADLEALRQRARVYALVRAYFAGQGVLEVETPVLSEAGNTEPNIDSFTTRFSGHRDAGSPQRWLRTSPEYPLKRLLAAGIGDCYELGRVFRNGEAGGRHNPEFTMLEWYRVGWDHLRLSRGDGRAGAAGAGLAGRRAEVLSLSYRELFLQATGVDPFTAGDAQLQAPLDGIGIDSDGLGRDDWLDLLMTHRIQPHFPADRITVVHDWPASQCALAKVRDGDPPVAERFELYLGRFELANGYHELTDAAEQRARFQRDDAVRARRGRRGRRWTCACSRHCRRACRTAGVALGIERLLMAMAGTDRIGDVLAFDFARG